MSNAPFRRRIFQVTASMTAYPWNYGGDGWPNMIGVPGGNPAFREKFGDSLQPTGIYPSTPPWTGDRGLSGAETFIKEELLDPPFGYAFVSGAPEYGDEILFPEGTSMVLWAGPLSYGQYTYYLSAVKWVQSYKDIYYIGEKPALGTPIMAVLGLLGVLAMTTGASNTINKQNARRRRKRQA